MEETTKILLEQGLLGATIILLIGVTIFMQRKIDKKELENTPPATIKTDSKYKKRQ